MEAFLQGPREKFTLTGFASIKEARKGASALTGGYSYYRSCGSDREGVKEPTHSFTAQACGAGRNARVEISKTRVWWDQMVRGKAAYGKELEAVQALLR